MNIPLEITLGVLMVMDGAITADLLKSGAGFEANPFVAYAIKRFGIDGGLLATRVFFFGFLIAMVRWNEFLELSVLLLSIVFGYIVYHNLGESMAHWTGAKEGK